MKFFKLSILLLTIMSIAACGDDDSDMSVCSQADWVGVYTGSETCTDEEGEDDVTLTITANGSDAIDFIYEYDDGSTVSNVDPIPLSNCNLSVSGTDQGFTLAVEANIRDGVINFVSTTSFSGTSSSCTIIATKN